MKRVEIWNVRDGRSIYNDVISHGFTDKERFFYVSRQDRTDYIPVYDIRNIIIMEDPKRGSHLKHAT